MVREYTKVCYTFFPIVLASFLLLLFFFLIIIIIIIIYISLRLPLSFLFPSVFYASSFLMQFSYFFCFFLSVLCIFRQSFRPPSPSLTPLLLYLFFILILLLTTMCLLLPLDTKPLITRTCVHFLPSNFHLLSILIFAPMEQYFP